MLVMPKMLNKCMHLITMPITVKSVAARKQGYYGDRKLCKCVAIGMKKTAVKSGCRVDREPCKRGCHGDLNHGNYNP